MMDKKSKERFEMIEDLVDTYKTPSPILILLGKISDESFEILRNFLKRQKDNGMPLSLRSRTIDNVLEFLTRNESPIHKQAFCLASELVIISNTKEPGNSSAKRFWGIVKKVSKQGISQAQEEKKRLELEKYLEENKDRNSNFSLSKTARDKGWRHLGQEFRGG